MKDNESISLYVKFFQLGTQITNITWQDNHETEHCKERFYTNHWLWGRISEKENVSNTEKPVSKHYPKDTF